MVVITILGLIAAAVGVSVMSNLEEAKQKTAALDIKTLETGLKLHYMKTGSFRRPRPAWKNSSRRARWSDCPRTRGTATTCT